jgi:phosphatidylglycerophosphate synthase
MLDALGDRVWDGVVLASIGWVSRLASPSIAVGALVALGASFLSAYVRAKGASLGYAVEESHVTRGIRYALIAAGLGFAWLRWTIWAAAAVSILAVVVRTAQVAREERAA